MVNGATSNNNKSCTSSDVTPANTAAWTDAP